jgi:hypothetical protein
MVNIWKKGRIPITVFKVFWRAVYLNVGGRRCNRISVTVVPSK